LVRKLLIFAPLALALSGGVTTVTPFDLTPWNGSSTASPIGTAGNGLSSPVTFLPSDLPTTHWHTTARPWLPLNISASTYLTRLNNMVGWYAAQLNTSSGCWNGSTDPYTGSTTAPAYGTIEIPFGVQFKAGNLANLNLAIAAMNCSTSGYAAHTVTQDFNIGPLNLAYQLYNTYGGTGISSFTKSGWLSQLNHWYGVGNNTNNWGIYDMWGAWLAIQNGLSAFTSSTGSVQGTSGIDCMWTGATCAFNTFTMHQANQFNDPPFNLYMDQNGVTPDGLWVERQATTLLLMIAEGYNGAQTAAVKRASYTAAQTGLLMQAPDGESASGGRQDHHPWVEQARQLTDEIMAQQIGASNPFLAGQFEHAAQMNFNQNGHWLNPACCNGATFFPTKAHYNPTLSIGQQYASGGDYGYNTQLMYFLAGSYLYRTASAITEQPMPSEIGGYAFATNSDFGPQTLMAAGGTAVEAAMAGSTAYTTFDNPTLWTALGIEKIGRVNWEARIGPADTGYPSLGTQVSFGPTWIRSGSTWTRLAQNPSTCHGGFTTTFANPAVTFGKIVWTCTGSPAPVFTQNLTITPDGVLSQTTCSGCPSTWGMTFPILTSDGTLGGSWGTTTTTTSTTQPIASVTWPATGDTQNYMTIAPTTTTTFANESNVTAMGGNITPVRAWHGTGSTPDATQTTFIYPMKSGEPSAASVRSGMTIPPGTTNQYSNTALGSSVTSGSSGTYYIGSLAAGGWAQSITIGGQTETFTAPCYFIMTLSSGKVSSIEADRNVTVSIPNGVLGSHTGAKAINLTAYLPVTGL
jgi:hypothetical protein